VKYELFVHLAWEGWWLVYKDDW